jgi:hypothetical protein
MPQHRPFVAEEFPTSAPDFGGFIVVNDMTISYPALPAQLCQHTSVAKAGRYYGTL